MSGIGNVFQNGKILFLAKVNAFSNREHTYNYIAHANFNCDSPKLNFKIYLGTKTKVSEDQNFDLGLKSENIVSSP